jgi:hypothetical protein
LSRPAPGLSRGGEPGQGRSVGEGPPVGGRGELVGRGGGGRRSEVEVEGNGLGARAAVKIRQFASGRFASSRLGMGEGIGTGPHTRVLWCRWLGAASGMPPMYTHRPRHIYIYIHTMLLSGRWCTTLVARYIFLQIRWVPIPRRQYLGGMVPNARRRGGCCPGVHPKGPRDFRDLSNG